MKAYLKWIVLITWSFTMTSCIKENLPECIPDNTGIVLKFRYPTGTNTPSNKNGIDRLSVFIFDDKGVFVSQINDSLIWIDDNYELELPYKRGSYQFVTWAGYNEATYGITTCIPGQTHIEDFFLFLKRDTDNRVTDQPKLLYHGIHETVALDEHEKMIAWINLKQITNHIRVIAHNLDKDISHNIYIEDNNGKYGYSSLFAHDDPILYIPVYMRVAKESNTLTADFNVMKLDKNWIPRLQIVDETNTVCYDENLIGELLGKNPNINLENEHDFTIEISFNGYSPIDIKINGWDIKESDEM